MSIIGSLPYLLLNGTVADATKVMADLNYLISQVNSNAAHNGANSDITSLSGLTTPLSVAQGGTGSTEGTIAFEAYVLGDQSSGSTIIFNTILNETADGSYDETTGVFTAPTTGWYHFDCSLQYAGSAKTPGVEFMLNGSTVRAGFSATSAVTISLSVPRSICWPRRRCRWSRSSPCPPG